MWLKHCIASIYVVDQVKEMGLGGWRGDRISQKAGRVEAPDNSLTFCLWVSWYTGHVMRTYVAKGGGCCSAPLLWCKNSYQWTSGTNLWLLAGILSGCDCCQADEDNSATVAFSSDFFLEHKGSPRMSPNLCSFEAPCTKTGTNSVSIKLKLLSIVIRKQALLLQVVFVIFWRPECWPRRLEPELVLCYDWLILRAWRRIYNLLEFSDISRNVRQRYLCGGWLIRRCTRGLIW